MGDRILVTGSTGFLGRALIARLSSQKCSVTAFMRNSSAESLIPRGIQVVRAELTSVEPLRTLLQKFDVVIHCAAEMAFAPRDVQHLYTVNVVGTANLAKAAALAGVKQFIYISSTETVAPTSGETPATEETEPSAVFEYGRSKIIAEQEVINACQGTLTHYTILRPTGILGAGDLHTAHQLFWAANMGLFFFVPGTPEENKSAHVSYTHISDIVKAITLCINNKHAFENTFFLSTNSMSYEAVVRHSCQQLGRMQPFIYLPFGLARIAMAIMAPIIKWTRFPQVFLFQPIMIDQMRVNRRYSNEKAKRLLSWEPAYSMEDGITDMIRVQRNTGLLANYSISPVAIAFFVIIAVIIFYLLFWRG